ncbi:MAG TPA: replicative DNA helicase [Opitutae bacterium]|nr:replicative DNA helicase [Opitutae bacterium]
MSANSLMADREKSRSSGLKSRKRGESPFHFGERVPPHSIDAEQALLACCVIDGGQESMTHCIEHKIRAESFFKPAHQLIFAALLDLYNEGTPVDEIILAEKLQMRGALDDVGGHAYLNEITDRIATTVHLPHYLERVRDTALLREVIRTATQAVEQAYSPQEDIDQFLENVEQVFFAISENRTSDSAKSISQTMDVAANLVQRMLQRKGQLTGVTSGFTDLDKLTFGFHAQEMIVVAGRPSMGKTGICLNMAEAAILPPHGKGESTPTLIFSLEMSAEQLAMRLLCSRARVNMTKLKDGFLPAESQREISRVVKELKEAPLWIDDSGNLSILDIRAKARRIASQNKLGCIIIDYLQLIRGTDSRVPREQQISEISRGIKAMAKELNVPVIVPAQLNRESEKERRQPRLSDLRESGAIEQDADLVMLISKRKDANDEEELAAGVVLRDLIVAKQRNGPVGVVPLAFTKNLIRFENYTEQPL